MKPPSERPPDELDFLLRAVKGLKVMTREEEYHLAKKTKSEDKKEAAAAKEEFLQRNVKLVLKVARGYACDELTLADLVQEGSVGLMRALEKFDPELGFKFSTYASWWIRQSITRAIHNSGAIRIPPYLISARWRLTRIEKDHPLDDDEAAEVMSMQEKHVKVLRNLPSIVLCFDNLMGEDSETTFGEMVPEEVPSHEEIEKLVERGQVRRLLEEAFEDMPERDLDILFRWASGEQSLEEVGQIYGVSRERVRQIVLARIKELKKRLPRK